ncbi:MAG: lamin tail domain-containing protein [Verrucomicrobia bacterium]|nr:lamin tail domain-containing protein [Verrucomicrobiota bacterium]
MHACRIRSGLAFVLALVLILLCSCWIPLQGATVVLNEIVTAPSERLLDWDAAGQPSLGTSPAWRTLQFAALDWHTGTGPFGFGYADLGTDLGDAMRAVTPSLYLRREFQVDAAMAGSSNGLRLRIEYDDGFVAYLNGVEIARRNLGPPGLFVYADQPAFNAVTQAVEEVIALGPGLLAAGTNVLAVQVHGLWPPYDLFLLPVPFDETLRLHATLECTSSPVTPLVTAADPWRYRAGFVEPAGGVCDPLVAEADPAGAGFADWVELHNTGAETVPLAGWSLTDNPDNPRKWVFPDVVLPPGGFLVVLCSELDRRDPLAGLLHTNFRLDQDGEYLGLFDRAGLVASEMARRFPRVPPLYSWGRDPDTGAYVYFRQATPGQPNAGPGLAAWVDPPVFSAPAGFYDSNLVVVLSCPTREVTLRYTADGTEPTEAAGTEYHGPLLLTSNVTLRVRAFRSGWIPSSVVTATYLVNTPTALQSMLALNVAADSRRALYAPQGVLAIQGGVYAIEDAWVPTSPSDYNMATMHGNPFERPASVEWIAPHLPAGHVQIDCGLRIAGSRWSRPRMHLSDLEYGSWNLSGLSKPSFGLFFRGDYGAGDLDAPLFAGSSVTTFDSLRLRAGKNDWLNPFIRDEVVRRLSLAMGHVSSHGLVCNLFVNGQYKSYYNLVERYRNPFFQSHYRSTNNWDVITVDEVEEGDAARWTEDVAFVSSYPLSNPALYAEAQARFDLVNFADYLLLNIYAAMWDWPQNNFYAARERAPGALWRFYVWDAEGSFGLYTSKDATYNSISNDLVHPDEPYYWPHQVIPTLYRALATNAEFRLLFADRVQKHMANGGALTAGRVLAQYDALKRELDPALVHLGITPVFATFMTNWVNYRPAHILEHFRSSGLWPALAAPVFSHHGGSISPGFLLVISNANARGSVYYTLNGTDPRAVGGQPVGNFLTGPILLTAASVVKARVLDGGEWSPLTEAVFSVPPPTGLVISEINFDPTSYLGAEGALFEFVEIQNTSPTPAYLTGVAFTEGVSFAFPPGATLAPGAFVVVAANSNAFASRYPGVPVAGQFASGKLDNSGERLTLAFWTTNVLFTVRYDNNPPWPVAPAGGGATLVPASSDITLPDDFRYWRASTAPGGSPGAADPPPSVVPVVISEVLPRADAVGGWMIELHNPAPAPANLGGWWLSDSASNPTQYRFPNPTLIPPGGFLQLNPQTFISVPPANRVEPKPDGGDLILYAADDAGSLTGHSSVLNYGASVIGLSFGRHTNSQNEVQFPALAAATPGAANAPPRIGPVVLNEIMYHPTPGNAEFIELINFDNNPVPLFDVTRPELTWRIHGLDYVFPPDLILLPGELMLVVNMDPGFFRTKYDVPADVRILGPWGGTLQDNGERLRLQYPERLPNGEVVHVTLDEVRYDNHAPWPGGAAGHGDSLQRVAPRAYGDDPQSWAAGWLTPGRVNLQAPEIVITAPAYGSWTAQGGTVAIHAVVDNLAGDVVRVEFFADTSKLGEDATTPYGFSWIASQAGSHTLQAVALTTSGLAYTSTVVRVQVLAGQDAIAPLVPADAVWKYLDTGANLGTSWWTVAFNDAGWAEGPAELGYGDAADGRPEATVVSYGPNANNKYVTTYFRHAFIADPNTFAGDAQLRLLVDDGAVVYLNGQVLIRYNMPVTTIHYLTYASANAPENYWSSHPVPRARLLPGTNLLAVEVHQVSAKSDDLSFALELTIPELLVEPWIVRHPSGQVVEAGRDVLLSVDVAGSGLAYQWHRLDGCPIPGACSSSLALPMIQADQAGGYYVVVTNHVAAVTSQVATVTVLLPDFSGQIVLSEIMYHPSSERADEEFVELHNLRDLPVSLAGWRFTKGVQFLFPQVLIPPGGFLAVAANPAAFAAKYPAVTNVVGGWQGTLRNSDEAIELEDSLGRRIDLVHYADRGDWAVRQRGSLDYGTRGWEWLATHDGLGRSLELVNPRLPNEHGQNWTASVTPQGTPGSPNSAAAGNLAPMILETLHTPAVPAATNPVAVTARIVDESASGLTVTLHYRNHSTTSPPPFLTLTMNDDGLSGDGAAGDGVYGALIPHHPHGTVVEFHLGARDAQGLCRTWPAPAMNEYGARVQAANALYQVDADPYAGPQPLLHLVMTETERRTLETINRASNAEMNGTLVSLDGADPAVRYNAGIRIRGGSTRYVPVPSLRVNLPTDQRWKEVRAVNLNTYFPHDQVVGSMVSFKANLNVANARAVQVRVNGANLAQPGTPNAADGSGFGTYALLEVMNTDWADHHLPNDPDGNIYLARRPNTDLAYKGTNWLDYANTGYSKNSNESENDWSDLIRLTDVLNNTPDAAYADQVRQVLDPGEWARYFALNSILGNNESSLAIGVGDDYNLYRGVRDPRFLLIPHDWDTILGQAGGLLPDADLFLATALPAVRRFLKHPEFVPLYYGELKRLTDTVCSPTQLHPLLDQFLGGFADPATLASMKQYVVARAAYVQSRIPLSLTVTSALPVVGAFPKTTAPAAALWGQAHAIDTRTVLVNGQPAAWSAWDARWTNAQVGLLPGINRVLVQALDAAGAVRDETTITLWYEDGTETSLAGGTLAGNTTWSAASGPYYLANHLAIPAGASLTVAPGTTVFVAPGVRITVGGRLQVSGTPTQWVHFMLRPGVASLWPGFQFTNSASDNSLACVVIDKTSHYPIDVRNSRLHLESILFQGVYGAIYTSNSALRVRSCVFPTMLGAETIIGSAIPTNGYLILENNTFGGTSGYADIIDFTGGKRPNPIIQVYSNVFLTGPDDGLDMDFTDAHIEGNTFMHFHRDAPRESISCGIATDESAQIVAVRNVFFDCDNAVLLKRNAWLTAQNNTFVNCVETAVDFGSTNRAILPGQGALFEGNISWGHLSTFERYYEPGYSDVDLTVQYSLIQGTNWPGIGNLSADPLFVNPTNDFRLRPGSPAIAAGPNGLDMGAHVPAGASIRGEPPPLFPHPNATLTIAGPGITHYRYQINNGPFSPQEWPVSTPLVLTNLTNGTYTVAVIGKNSAASWQPTDTPTRSKTWTVNTSLRRLWLNEVLARNDSALNHYGTFPDLIELYNAGAVPCDLAGLQLTDNPAVPGKFVFPAGVTLEPGEFLVLFANDPDGTPGWHLGFSLRREGETVCLHDAAANGGALLDSVTFGLQLPDCSVGRLSDGTWSLTSPTPGAANLRTPLGDSSRLRFSEWLARGPGDDFIELYNPCPVPVALGGLHLTDNPLGWPGRHRIADLSFAPGCGFVVFHADHNLDAGADHLDFALAHEQGLLGLFDANLQPLDCVAYGPQHAGASTGRLNPDAEQIAEFVLPSPGATNILNAPPAVTIAFPTFGQVFPASGDVPLGATASDTDGHVVRVEFYGDGTLIGESIASPYTVIWPGVAEGPHAVVAKAVDNAGAVAVSDVVEFNVGLTTVRLTSPEDDLVVPVGTTVPLRASVSISTSSVLRVEFYADNTKLGETTSVPYAMVWTGTNPGPAQLRAVAITTRDESIASPPVPIRWLNAQSNETAILVASNALWKYWDTNAAPTGAWTASGYNDSAWPAGPAELGYGDAPYGQPEATVISYGPDPNNKYPTAYFRHAFVVDQPDVWRHLTLRLLVDDGALVYLNEHIVVWHNLPPGPITFTTYTTNSGEGNCWLPFSLPDGSLTQGTNLLAAEVHQVQPASGDLSFALELTASQLVIEPWILTPPAHESVEAGFAATLWVEAAGIPLYYQWHQPDGAPIGGATQPVLRLTNVQPDQAGGYHVVVSNALGSVTSTVAVLTVETPDRDEDGIPDYWELQQALDPADPADASADWDGDLMVNRHEYRLRTSPWIPDLFLHVHSLLTGGSSPSLHLQFRAEAGVSYVLEENINLAPDSWQPLIELPVSPANGPLDLVLPASAKHRFYRLRQLAPTPAR